MTGSHPGFELLFVEWKDEQAKSELLNNGDAKTPNGEFGPFRRFRAENAARATERRRTEPANLAAQNDFL